jgi:hypothetical protein
MENLRVAVTNRYGKRRINDFEPSSIVFIISAVDGAGLV